MVQIAFYFIIGIAITNTFIDNVAWNVTVQCCLSAIFAVILFVLYKLKTKYAFSTATAMFCIVLGSTLFLIRYNFIRYAIPNNKHHIQGEVTDMPQKKAKTIEVKIKTSNDATVIAYLEPKDTIKIGDSIELNSDFGTSSTCVLDNKDSAFMDYHKYLFYQGISATCYAKTGAWNIQSKSSKTSIYSQLHSLQQQMGEIYHEAGFNGNEGAIIEAMTTGAKQSLSKHLRQQFSNSGVSHVLALSGFHLSIIYMLLEVFFFTKFVTIKWKAVSRIMITVCIWAFVIIAGAPPSLVRAAIMCSVMILTQISGRNVKPLDSLSLTAIVMLCGNPLLLFDVGFQLSFLSMLGLVTFGHKLNGIIKVRSILLQKAIACFSTTVVCSIFTLPLVGYYFGIIPILSVVSNFIVSLLAFALLMFAVIWWGLFFIPTLQVYVGWLLMGSASLMDIVTHYISSIECATICWQPNKIGVTLCYSLIYVLYLLIKRFQPKA